MNLLPKQPTREHDDTSVQDKRAPCHVAPEEHNSTGRGPGTISWAEHLQAWSALRPALQQALPAEQLAAQGGFSYDDLTALLGHEPLTWEPTP